MQSHHRKPPTDGPPYTGRFAPSPTGPLHFGSLVCAVASFLEARSRNGRWLVRMEDLDPPRERPGADTRILRTLEAWGLTWDGEVVYQSRRQEAYELALQRLDALDLLYPCTCTRRQLAGKAASGQYGAIYPGHCRNGTRRTPTGGHALRVRTHDRPVGFTDRLMGRIEQRLEPEVGDFVLRRRDGLTAYQLAVVVDDAWQGVTDVVRGADLLDSTPRQRYLQILLALPAPSYLHLPVVTDTAGVKLSKQTGAPPLPGVGRTRTLWRALVILGQAPPAELAGTGLDEFWDWAIAHWDAARIPARRTLRDPALNPCDPASGKGN